MAIILATQTLSWDPEPDPKRYIRSCCILTCRSGVLIQITQVQILSTKNQLKVEKKTEHFAIDVTVATINIDFKVKNKLLSMYQF